MKAAPSSTGAVAAHRAARPPGEEVYSVTVPHPRPIGAPAPAPVNVVLGAPCQACGYRRRTEFIGLPTEVAQMLAAAFERSGLTKADLTRRIGIASRSYVAKLLAGTARPSQPVAHDIIDALALTWREGEQLLAASGGERDRRGQKAS